MSEFLRETRAILDLPEGKVPVSGPEPRIDVMPRPETYKVIGEQGKPLPEPEPVEPEPSLQEQYDDFKAGLPKRKDFHQALSERAGVEPDEQEEIMKLIEERRRLKHGD